MPSTTAFICAAMAGLAAANSVLFVNQDPTTRTVVFTAEFGKDPIPSLVVAGHANGTAVFPPQWTGNWFSVSEGATHEPGMLGEVAFDGWNGLTYFDVSAIVNPNDHHGVKTIKPLVAGHPLSGCQRFPCSNAYNKPDDIQTLSTPEKDLVCMLGTQMATISKERRHPRHFLAHIHASQ